MTLIPIEGLSTQAIEEQSTAPTSIGLKPFPCDGASWTRHTATVTKAEIKVFDTGSEAISMQVANGQHGGEVLVNLPPYEAAYQEKAFETLIKTIKILGCHTDGKLDSNKLSNAGGQIIEIIAKHKGFRVGKDGRDYHKVSLILTGEAKALLPVTMVQMPSLPGCEVATDPDLIPF